MSALREDLRAAVQPILETMPTRRATEDAEIQARHSIERAELDARHSEELDRLIRTRSAEDRLIGAVLDGIDGLAQAPG